VSGRDARGARARPVRARPLDLIHRSKVSAAANRLPAEVLGRAAELAGSMVPATSSTRLAERLGRAAALAAQSGCSSFSLDVGPGDSQAVADCVEALRRNLEAGAYDRTT
jgi:L-alanine-DL-glutamate epimerase-like enolase superfamily enzyme